MPNLMQLVLSRKKHMCIVKTAAGGGSISVHNSQWASGDSCSWSTHFALNQIKLFKIWSVRFVKITTWKFISWSQGKLLVFVIGQSRNSRENTCHAWSCFFLVQANIGEEHVTHTKATLMRFHWCFLFSWIDLEKYGWRVKKSSSCVILYSLYLHRQHTSNHPCTFRTAWLFHNVVHLFLCLFYINCYISVQGCIFRLTCSPPELTEDHVLTSAYVKIFRTVTRIAVNKSVWRKKDFP